MMMGQKRIPPTAKRVAYHTNPKVNQAIRDQTLYSISTYQDCSEDLLSEKIRGFNKEWDTERFLETNAATLILFSSMIGCSMKKRSCLAITGTVGFFLLLHALHGWCPPLPVLRRFGIRTTEEINNEKMVFKLMRGDFSKETKSPEELLEMIEKC